MPRKQVARTGGRRRSALLTHQTSRRLAKEAKQEGALKGGDGGDADGLKGEGFPVPMVPGEYRPRTWQRLPTKVGAMVLPIWSAAAPAPTLSLQDAHRAKLLEHHSARLGSRAFGAKRSRSSGVGLGEESKLLDLDSAPAKRGKRKGSRQEAAEEARKQLELPARAEEGSEGAGAGGGAGGGAASSGGGADGAEEEEEEEEEEDGGGAGSSERGGAGEGRGSLGAASGSPAGRMGGGGQEEEEGMGEEGGEEEEIGE